MALDQLRSIYLSAGYKSADLQHLFHPPATPTRKNSQAPVFSFLALRLSFCPSFLALFGFFGSFWLLHSCVLGFLFLDVRLDHGAHTLV